MNSELVPALFIWYLRVGSDPCHFANFANDVHKNVPRTTKRELDAGFHRTRSRERKRARTSSQNAFNIVPESSKIIPQSSQRAPEELHRAPEEFQRASQEPPDLPTEPLKLPRAVQGASKGSPRDPFGKHSGTILASKLRSRSRYWLTF